MDCGVMPFSIVVSLLDDTAAFCLINCAAHGVRHLVGVQNGAAIQVAGGAADGLNQRALRAQEAFLVRIEDGDQGNFREVETFAQEVDADQHVVFALAQVAQQSHTFERLNLGMHVAAFHADFGVVAGQVFGHALGQRGDQHALVLAARSRISASRSSIWPLMGRISTGGSSRPVGRMICSTTTPEDLVSS